uniref:Nuclear transcription factor Y subunit n=1 Tax=Euplotes crassus TaxID=5936 RepID=A0A7S3NTF1_EUPCR|mmetsp:Transcript_18497/g.18193  ORF Transcript_18497/g.18193 Transcript_18497/m.18193 type:complete len:217 (+) Transcript_18497:136-786(+)|eukprot:CAMPEP_0197006040 /NCGR_PEP_ID=MMETSP1380-20130617/32862_1 /TAXON_ID=5936 /ORGANISM="Euplotes crassus, Strain CT5" /LENGTH=216 /DNA_ID=CAMNT_0042425437 /DNA_START=128 /DNA_END=778 /DNA_ORIENTATION=+
MGSGGLSLTKKVSDISLHKPSPCPSSIKPTPQYDPLGLLGGGSDNFALDTKAMKYIKLDFLPIGSPEINFVLGPPAMDLQPRGGVSAKSFALEPSKSMFAKHTQVPSDEKIAIKHIQNGGPTIFVTNKRVKRILKRRKKRVAFLLENPEFSLPYKFRTKGPKHQSRSKSAKGRQRKNDGRFARVGDAIDFTVPLDDPAMKASGEDQSEEDIVRNNF